MPNILKTNIHYLTNLCRFLCMHGEQEKVLQRVYNMGDDNDVNNKSDYDVVGDNMLIEMWQILRCSWSVQLEFRKQGISMREY